MNAMDRYRSLTNARKFLMGLSESDATPHGTRSLAHGLLCHYPTDEEINMMVALEEDCQQGRIGKKRGDGDPVEFSGEKGGWIFWDESWAHYHGPFTTRAMTEEALLAYAKEYLGE